MSHHYWVGLFNVNHCGVGCWVRVYVICNKNKVYSKLVDLYFIWNQNHALSHRDTRGWRWKWRLSSQEYRASEANYSTQNLLDRVCFHCANKEVPDLITFVRKYGYQAWATDCNYRGLILTYISDRFVFQWNWEYIMDWIMQFSLQEFNPMLWFLSQDPKLLDSYTVWLLTYIYI